MADIKISALTPEWLYDGTEKFEVVVAGESYSVSALEIARYVNAPMICTQTSDRSLTSTTAAQRLFGATANGRLTLPEAGAYLIEGQFYLTGMSGTSGNGSISILGAGSATFNRQLLHFSGIDATAPGTAAAHGGNFALGANAPTTNSVTAATGTATAISLRGIANCTAAGTVVPSISLVTAAAAVFKAGSWIKYTPILNPSGNDYRGAWD